MKYNIEKYYPKILLDTEKDKILVKNYCLTSLYVADYLCHNAFYKFQHNSNTNYDLNFWLVNVEESKAFIKSALKNNFEHLINQKNCQLIFGENWKKDIYHEYKKSPSK